MTNGPLPRCRHYDDNGEIEDVAVISSAAPSMEASNSVGEFVDQF